MSVKVFEVDKKSKCARKGIRPGFKLLTINGNEINDVLDYRFYSDDNKLVLTFSDEKGKVKTVRLRNVENCDSIGLEFETYLMDKHRRCKNSCIFCFIDQLPKGMRESLYFKDDDSRLSFLFGNYITLTNLTDRDVNRIIKMHISPVNVSVHTMNPELRVRMMRNPDSGDVLRYLTEFSDAGISINAQLVLCPGINDGKELDYSLQQLAALNSVKSVAAVPVGLTKYRDNLFELTPFNKESAAAVIDLIDRFNESLTDSGREKLAYPSDEFFQLAQREIPDVEYYCDFPQIDNGVGLYASLKHDFLYELDSYEADLTVRDVSVATGRSAYGLMRCLAEEFCKKFSGTKINVYCIENDFFGELVTVAGLITGQDLIRSLKKQGFDSHKLLLPSVMFKSRNELIFLDDVTVEDVENTLNTKVVIVDNDASSLLESIIN